ncbi:MAG: arginine--tRNA ligase [Deltaproteobacteria bacterium]|nr:MAG: arginine--tRNA ligase [Deltaproteobacteria bacterium]
MKRHLEALLRQALNDAITAGELPVDRPPPFTVEVPADLKFGDLATNVALVLARQAGRPPRAVADTLLARLRDPEGWLAGTEVAGPGFINFRFAPSFWRMLLAEALGAGESYGRSTVGAGRRVQVEFVSANPTGPLHIGHGRGAVLGDVTARLLEAVGYEVEREYYVNDFGRQMDMLGRSTWIRHRQLRGEDVALGEDAYPGEYLIDVARALAAEQGDELARLPEAEAVARCREFAARALLAGIQEDLARFGVRFDHFVSERALHAESVFARARAALPADLLYEQDGALFFRTTHFGDEKDRVVVRGNGEPTYFGSDIAHYYRTLSRRFDALVNVLGADHHGYVARLRAVVAAFGFDPAALRVLLVQLVNLTRGGEPVRMGKRAGEFVTLREVVDEVGADAARFFFLLRKADSQLDFDLELAKKQSTDNPVFYVQYAHARIASVLRQAADAGIVLAPEPDLTRLGDGETEPLRVLVTFPDVVEAAARDLEPHRIVFYALDLAAAFHRYYNQHRILSDDPGATQARLALVRCVQQVLRAALELAGVRAPERM